MNRILLTITLAGLGFSSVAICSAQTTQTKESTKPMTVTGCLAAGSQTGDYSIRDSSGKTYDLTGTKVDMKAHLGHEVTITGTPAAESETTKAAPSKAEEGERLQVSDLKMVSTTCK